ncbi:MAG: 2-phospho-L-lactate guanylyltransferase [Nocardioidaceae bacterium]
MARSFVMSTPAPTEPSWSIIVPVKQTMIAKSRLHGFTDDGRRALALAFALDTVAAAVSCPAVRRLVVVTNEPAAQAFREAGADVIADRPDAGLNAAIVHGAQSVRATDPGCWMAALAGDLPALSAETLTTVLSLPHASRWFVPDSAGLGTTMLAASPSERLWPRFGPRSRALHRAEGAEEVNVPGLERLRRDVDTEVDLWDAVRLGVGPYTRDVLSDLDRKRLA